MKNNYKMYISLALYAILGLAIGYAVAKGVIYVHDRYVAKSEIKTDNNGTSTSTVKTFEGEASAQFEGLNTIAYAFVYDGAYEATSTKPRYVYVKNGTTTVATIYLSYEGGRGYTGSDYINNVVKKFVPTVSVPDTMTHGEVSWTHATSTNSAWHIIADGEWLAVIETKKDDSDKIKAILETFSFAKIENK